MVAIQRYDGLPAHGHAPQRHELLVLSGGSSRCRCTASPRPVCSTASARAAEHVAGPRLHPGLQVAAYCEYIADILGVLSNARNPVRGAAYLQHALDRDVSDLFALRPTDQTRIFTTQRRGQFLDYLKAHLAPASGAAAADRFLISSVRPSQHLLQYAAPELRERSHFTLLDEQRTAYELVFPRGGAGAGG